MSLQQREDLVNQGVEAGLKWAHNVANHRVKKNPVIAREASQVALSNLCLGIFKLDIKIKTTAQIMNEIEF